MPKTHRLKQEVKLTPTSKPIIQKASISIEENDETFICVNHNGEELLMNIKYWNHLVMMVDMLKIKAKV